MPHFNAYHALLSVEKSESEALNSLINRVDEQIRVIKSLSPSSFTLDDLYDKLAVIAIIRALPHSFDNIVHTISILEKFDKQSVVQSLHNMDHTCTKLSSTTSAFAASSAAPRCSQNASPLQPSSSSPFSSQKSQNRASNHPKCNFCSHLGHIEAKCFLKEKLMRQIPTLSSTSAAPASTTPQSNSGAPQFTSIASASALHWQAAKHVLRYLKGTLEHKLIYKPSNSSELFITYFNSDHGGNLDNRRSTGGYVVKIGSGAISWSSKLQSLVAQSTTEAEHIATVEAGKGILWMCQFMGELGYDVSGPSLLWMDNQSAIAVNKNLELHLPL